MSDTAIAVIPARGGSTRVPHKNARPFHGKPIIAYSIEAAKKSGLFSHIIVSTDSKNIAEISVMYGATDVHCRNAEMSRNEVGTQEVVRHVLEEYNDLCGQPAYTCCIYPTAPLMWPKDLVSGLRDLVEHQEAQYCFPVGLFPIQDAGQWYWGKTVAFMGGYPLVHPQSFYDTLIRKMVLPEERVCDINTEMSWVRAELLYSIMTGG